MELTRTANAGVLLKLDGISFLLDGICREVKPYPATPLEERGRLMEQWPDIVAFTHMHKDHYDPAYAVAYTQRTGRVILGPRQIHGSMESVTAGIVTITPVPSRHIGTAGKTVEHASFVIRGSSCVWFLGDSAPIQWRNRQDLPRPDVLIVPYAYANTPAAWQLTQSLGAREIILLHMPEKAQDTIGLWNAVKSTVTESSKVRILNMLQTEHI